MNLDADIPPLPPEAEIIEPTPLSLAFAAPEKPVFEWTEEQRIALNAIDTWYDSDKPFVSLTGPSGSGKTSLVREIVDRYPDAVLTAMTGKAALRLSQLTGRVATTLHSKLYWPPNPGEDLRFTRLREPPSELVCIDEFSMCPPLLYQHLQKWAQQGVRFLGVGDTYQLPPVITGKELQEHGEDFSVFSYVKGPALETVMRNAGGVLRSATKVRQTGEICEQSDMDNETEGYEFVRTKSPIELAVETYLADMTDHFLITWKNSSRMSANKIIREHLGHDGPLPDEGEPVLIRKNGQGFLNGEIVECAGFDDGPKIGSLNTLWMKVANGQRLLVSVEGGRDGEFFDGGQPWIRDWKKFHADLKRHCLPDPIPVTFGYCNTCHQSQGSQCRRATVFLCPGDDRSQHFRKLTTLPDGSKASFSARWVYTSTTRSTHRTTMIVGR